MYKVAMLGAVILFLFTGCAIKEVMPAVKTYNLKINLNIKKFAHSRCDNNVLKVRSLKLNSLALTDNIYYGIGKYYINSYTQSQWLQRPSYRINYYLIAALQKSHIFKAVIPNEVQGDSNLLLEYNIDDFAQYFNQAKTKSYVDVRIRFLLINMLNNRLIASKTFDKRLFTISQNAIGGVQAFGEATGEVISKAIVWVDHICNINLKKR